MAAIGLCTVVFEKCSRRMQKYPILAMVFFFGFYGQGQNSVPDSIPISKDIGFNYRALIVPTVFIGYGLVGLENDRLKLFNTEIKEEVNEHIDTYLTIDDFSQYAPALTVYGLNALGIKGKNNFKDRTVILATSYLLMSSSVLSLKAITKVERPDGSSKNSFPSGHTATAFMGAEFLWQEYKDVSIWYGIVGYAVAAGTGVFRIYNDRHWLTDVVAGAGIGILSTKVAYWIHPFIIKTCFRKKSKENNFSTMVPFYNGQQAGLAVSFSF